MISTDNYISDVFSSIDDDTVITLCTRSFISQWGIFIAVVVLHVVLWAHLVYVIGHSFQKCIRISRDAKKAEYMQEYDDKISDIVDILFKVITITLASIAASAIGIYACKTHWKRMSFCTNGENIAVIKDVLYPFTKTEFILWIEFILIAVYSYPYLRKKNHLCFKFTVVLCLLVYFISLVLTTYDMFA